MIATKLGYKQNESFQTVFVDRFTSEPYNLNEYNLNFAILSSVPVPPEIASIRAY